MMSLYVASHMDKFSPPWSLALPVIMTILMTGVGIVLQARAVKS